MDVVPVDLVEVAPAFVEAARRVTVAHNLRVEADQARVVGSFDASRPRALDNLISNAVTYGPAGGDGIARRWSDQVKAFVRVADQGIGVPAADRNTVFRFRRRGSDVGSIPGSGVGPIRPARLVEVMGGEIALAPSPTFGARFVACLPLAWASRGW